MSLRISFVFGIFLSTTLTAATREEEAKKHAENLKSKTVSTRLTAVTELGKLGALQRKLTAPYVSEILKVTEDSDAKVRGEAARVVGLIDVPDKKAAVEKIAGIMKSEKSAAAREGQIAGLGELGATAEEEAVKQKALEALNELRKKSEDKREQKLIQAARIMITGKKKKD